MKMTREEEFILRIRKHSHKIYNIFNHIFLLNQKHCTLFGYFNECPIYLIYDYTDLLFKRYIKTFKILSQKEQIQILTKVSSNLSSFRSSKQPYVGSVFYNRNYREYYIIIDKRFVNCAGKYKHVVYEKILFHEIGHIFNKDTGPIILRYWVGKKYVKRNKERRADVTGKMLGTMFGIDTRYDVTYSNILKRTINKYSKKKLGCKPQKYDLLLIKRIKLLYK